MERWVYFLLIGFVLVAGGVGLWQYGAHANIPSLGGRVLSEREAVLFERQKLDVRYLSRVDEVVVGLILTILGSGSVVIGTFLFVGKRD